ncbi:hypothetical protein JYU34_009416 [Plutella xylostella]|uniref:Uncharacterized protein n=1 Tax=Plutella xylostella TaxID=51655 RepID=A0ABQ7QJE6_PLUXY|nr:hypothetical protein JYU34_009416 [Plutella xylostella]
MGNVHGCTEIVRSTWGDFAWVQSPCGGVVLERASDDDCCVERRRRAAGPSPPPPAPAPRPSACAFYAQRSERSACNCVRGRRRGARGELHRALEGSSDCVRECARAYDSGCFVCVRRR